MLLSSKANPNSWPARQARMEAQAAMRLATSPPLPTHTPALRDVKGVVTGLTGLERGVYFVYFETRDGQSLRLVLCVRNEDAHAKIKEARAAGTALELFYEETPRSHMHGNVVEVC